MPRHRRKGRTLNGLLLLDKPSGMTSNRALQKAKRIFNAGKAGHTGSLDPLATGLLTVCFGRATKISDFLLTSDKHYRVLLRLGATTDTGDADGRITREQDASAVTDAQVRQATRRLIGDVEQVPPMYSALKHQGTRLYRLARQGVEVARPPRVVRIHRLEVTRREGELLHADVHCSKGTYVRTLVEDLGKALGCGAYVVELRRTGLGPFVDPVMHTLGELEESAGADFSLLDSLLLPVDAALQSWPALAFDEHMMEEARHGRPVRMHGSPPAETVRIYDADNRFYGVGTVLEDGRIVSKRLS